MVFVGSNDGNTVAKKFKNTITQPFQENASSILIITSASLALEMGLPIYGICAYVHSSLKINDFVC